MTKKEGKASSTLKRWSLSVLLFILFFIVVSKKFNKGFIYAFVSALIAGYLPSYLDDSPLTGDRIWKWFQYLPIWDSLCQYFSPSIVNLGPDLKKDGLYIFSCHPHGIASFSHYLSMTNGFGFLSKVFNGERRDLAASVLFLIPLVREILLWLGCIDASRKSAERALRNHQSLLIFTGGEHEQLLTEPNKCKVVLNKRKGFVELAITHGATIIPIWVWGENELYSCSHFLLGLRLWIVKRFKIALIFAWGRGFTLIPYKVPLTMVLAKPIVIEKKEKPTKDDFARVHQQVILNLIEAFDATKGKYASDPNITLEIY